jgi:hypothetical protein
MRLTTEMMPEARTDQHAWDDQIDVVEEGFATDHQAKCDVDVEVLGKMGLISMSSLIDSLPGHNSPGRAARVCYLRWTSDPIPGFWTKNEVQL